MAFTACPECSGKVAESAKLCPHCGYPLGLGKAPPATSAANPTLRVRARTDRRAAPPTRGLGIQIAISLGFFAAGVGVGLSLKSGSPSPQSSVSSGSPVPPASVSSGEGLLSALQGTSKPQFKKRLEELGFNLKGLGMKGKCPQKDFYAKLGEPQGRMSQPGSAVDFLLTYPCSDGTIQLHIIEGGGARDKVFLMNIDEF